MRLFAAILFVSLSLSSSVRSAQRTGYTAGTHLDQMVAQAQTIIRGHVVSAAVGSHPQFSRLQVVVVTLKLDRVLKGSPPAELTFQQYIWDPRDVTNAGGYYKGEELLLFLNPISQYGLTSPVGMEQGRFEIVRDTSGNASAVNGRGNAGLFLEVAGRSLAKGISLSAQARAMLNQESGRVTLAALEETIQTLQGATK